MTELPRDFRQQGYLIIDEMMDYWHSEFDRACESPIETAFGVAFMLRAWVGSRSAMEMPKDTKGTENIPYHPDVRYVIAPQVKIDPYRVDFLAWSPLNKAKTSVVVECDGHDFHERTKQQAERDRSRDRELQTRGYSVFRFTGAELYRDAHKCALEVLVKINLLQMEADGK